MTVQSLPGVVLLGRTRAADPVVAGPAPHSAEVGVRLLVIAPLIGTPIPVRADGGLVIRARVGAGPPETVVPVAPVIAVTLFLAKPAVAPVALVLAKPAVVPVTLVGAVSTVVA
jgi:hypothetical protein